MSLPEAKLLLKEDDELIQEVFDYWSCKRKVGKPGCLLAVVKQEKRDGSSTSDPYVAFRRRTEKMQTRKVSVDRLESDGAHSPPLGYGRLSEGPDQLRFLFLDISFISKQSQTSALIFQLLFLD